MLFVFLGHFGTLWSQVVPKVGPAHYYLRLIDADATLGSSFFMLLSGFFAYGSLLRSNGPFRKFFFGRLRRLYPMYLIMVVIYTIGSIAIPHLSKLPPNRGDAFLFLLETLVLLPGLLPIAPLMDVSWTLSFVVLFYFIEAGVVRVFRAVEISRFARFGLLVVVAVLWACAGEATSWWQPRTAIFWVGMALLEAVEGMSGTKMKLATRLTGPAVAVALLGVWARTHVAMNPEANPVWFPATLCFLITAIALSAFLWIARFGPAWWKSLLSRQSLCQLGAASYSFYLTHGFTVKAFRYGLIPWLGARAGQPAVFWASQVLGIVTSVAIARAAYVLVENPIASWTPDALLKPLAKRSRDLRGTATPV